MSTPLKIKPSKWMNDEERKVLAGLTRTKVAASTLVPAHWQIRCGDEPIGRVERVEHVSHRKIPGRRIIGSSSTSIRWIPRHVSVLIGYWSGMSDTLAEAALKLAKAS